MNTMRKFCCAAAFATLLAGCSMQFDFDDSTGLHGISFHDGSIAVHARGAPNADITATGDLSIDGKAVALTPEQRTLLKQYYVQVMAVRDDGIATGKAGAAMAGHAIGSVASGLAHGDPDSIGPAIDARAKQVEAKAMAVCNDVQALQAQQNAIASALPAFRPYARIGARSVTNCKARQG
jgi:hypothetical protein